MRCPQCKNKLLQKSGTSTRLRIHGPVEFSEDGEAKAKCYWCKGVVSVPLKLDDPVLENERFTMRRLVRPPTA